MKRKKKKLTILLVLSCILLVLVLLFFFGSRKEKIKHLTRVTTPGPSPGQVKEVPMKKITLFFLSESDGLLHPEEREIPSSTLNQEVKAVVEELVRGSRKGLFSTIPENSRVRQAFVTSDGTAYVDLSRNIMEASYFGSSGEMALVYSIVNSLAFNFKNIKRVSLLIEGNERETLGGHIDLSRPFVPDFTLVAR